jgi:hypothetical protein
VDGRIIKCPLKLEFITSLLPSVVLLRETPRGWIHDLPPSTVFLLLLLLPWLP